MSRHWLRMVAGAQAAAAAAIAVPAFAQGAPQEAPSPSAEADAPSGNDIIVTAQRREQRLQDVPISVSVLSGSTLAATGVAATDGLQMVTPGLVTSRQLKGSTPYIRGLGTQSTAPGVESPVAQYVDGVYYMTPVGSLFSFNNIERVEVLKGPQGTLFGRNTTGGLIHVITRDPSADALVQGGFSYGNYDTLEANLYATGGSENLAGNIALYGIRNDGFGRNLTVGGRVNKLREVAGRVKLMWTPGEGTRVTLSADYNRNKGDIGTTRNALPGSLLLSARPFTGSIYDTQSGFIHDIDSKMWGVSAQIRHEFGSFQLQSTSAYRDLDSSVRFDQDSVPANFANVLARETAQTFQHEILLTGSLGRFDLTTGLFYFQAKNAYNPLSVRSIAPPNNFDTFSPQKLDSYAAFADGTFAITPETNLTAGIRYTIDDRSINARTVAAPGNSRPAGTVTASNNNSTRFEKATFRVVVDHKLTPDVMLYGSFNTGFKAGVFNPTVLTQAVIRPETVRAFEVGLKTDLLDRTLRFNVSAFHSTVKGIQLTRQTTGAQTVINVPEGRSKGFEVETAYTPQLATGRLQLMANFAVLDAKYVDFPVGQIANPNPAGTGGNVIVFGDLSGRRMVRSPKFTASFAFDYSVPIGAVELGASANYYHTSSFAWEPDNRVVQPGYDIINAQISLAFGNEHQFRVRVFGKNLTDKEYYSYVTAGGLGDLTAPSPPRTYGVGVDFRF